MCYEALSWGGIGNKHFLGGLVQYHTETGTYFVLNAGYRIGRAVCGIHVSASRTDSTNTPRNTIIFGFIRVGVCPREWHFQHSQEPFMFSDCSLTLSRLSLRYISSVCFSFVQSFEGRMGFWGHGQLNFACLSFGERQDFLFSFCSCVIKMVTPLIKSLTSRPLLVKEEKPSQTGAHGPEHNNLKYGSVLEQCWPSGIDMKMIVGTGWWNGIKNNSGDGIKIERLPSNL